MTGGVEAAVSESAAPDLVVVGGGVAGLTAGRRAQQLGGRVVILERYETGPGMGNGRLSGGWFHAAMLNPRLHSPDELFERVMAATDGHARPELVRVWADNVERALEFLEDQGGDFAPLDPAEESKHNVLMPPRAATIGRLWRGYGPDRMLSALWQKFVADGGTYLAGHRATSLVRDASQGVVGVVADTPHGAAEFTGGAVLLADGGFQGNAELVRQHITTAYKLRGSEFDTGDALQMGLAVGAQTVNMEAFYGYALCRDALTDDRLWPQPAPNALIAAGVVVDGHGRRFVDEGVDAERVANAIARCDTPDRCWVVFDETTWSKEGTFGDVPMNPTVVEVGATLIRADRIEDLALACGLPADTLQATLDEYHALLEQPSAHGVPRSGAPRRLQPPYYAVPLIAGITFAMGGLLVDAHGRVLDTQEQPIEGLYAAGGAMGGLQGGPRIGVAGGWSEASTFGLLVAEHVMARVRRGTGAP